MDTNTLALYWQPYKLFPYEKKLGLREAESLLKPGKLEEQKGKVLITESTLTENAARLVYFSHFQDHQKVAESGQYRIEQNGKKNAVSKKQNTRYASHGLHEYKGKFNPQVVKALLNIFGTQAGSKVLDPFCGSGTTLVESALSGLKATGTDINPLAIFIAKAKLAALSTDWASLQHSANDFLAKIEKKSPICTDQSDPERLAYLNAWFPMEILETIEHARSIVPQYPENHRPILLTIVSNLLRDYSHQEPSDLRIRRRKSPLPELPFVQALRNAFDHFIRNIQSFQATQGLFNPEISTFNVDIRQQSSLPLENHFDLAITSPPYATALPYIDTQRLSLVWLGLTAASEIRELEGTLIGSREFSTKSKNNGWLDLLASNHFNIPEPVFDFCYQLNKRLDTGDGFRKQALPQLLYRYFYDMHLMFCTVLRTLKPQAPFALIVGHNHTTIGGERTDIDTPALLALVGENAGFHLDENLPLEAYQRFGMHQNNAVQKESLLIFKKNWGIRLRTPYHKTENYRVCERKPLCDQFYWSSRQEIRLHTKCRFLQSNYIAFPHIPLASIEPRSASRTK